jgi:hypothetical protein
MVYRYWVHQQIARNDLIRIQYGKLGEHGKNREWADDMIDKMKERNRVAWEVFAICGTGGQNMG